MKGSFIDLRWMKEPFIENHDTPDEVGNHE
jgi:hypothetical protein